ncbi:hypothetical protein ABFA07_022002 [Porites harrisoni]
MKLVAICLLLASFHILVDIAEGYCWKSGYVGQSDWFSCFEKENNDCPHGFIKIKIPTSNSNYCGGSADKVCCLIVPRIQIEVKDSPCLDEPCKTSKSKNRKTREIAQQSIPRVLSSIWRKS